jgi:hypothetical protein
MAEAEHHRTVGVSTDRDFDLTLALGAKPNAPGNAVDARRLESVEQGRGWDECSAVPPFPPRGVDQWSG